ncbi:hypothetical protein AAFF_G00032060 [Aldrovandia affinis]|uniref:Uncharacterized protein n=1 Tax=Aldrovandia affinis TaxID=143900 RepID=A0AAD7WFV9_9TELE|nr:hypothetical protein AAFF_G00032060 [Aldrovandia affinis]
MLFSTNLPFFKKMFCVWVVLIIFGFGGVWTDGPWIKVSSSDIKEGDWVKVLCGVPIDYTGGLCRLYGDESKTPMKTLRTHSYTCEFLVSSHDLLAGRPLGTRTTVRCDYTLQNYVSDPGDSATVVVWGSAEKPVLTVSPRVVMTDDKVQVHCSTPRHQTSGCRMYRDRFTLGQTPCNHQMTGEKLMMWETTSIFNYINLNCKYDRTGWDYVRSKASDPIRILVVDPTKLHISTNRTFVCDVPAQVQDFVLSQTGNTSLSLAQGGTLILKTINNSTGPLHQTCRVI